MEKKRITYGVFGMMEYQAVIKVGSKNTMKVNFTDGSLTAMGTNPAHYSTDNFMVQHAIENSHDFKRGLIRKLGEVKLGGEVKIERNAPAVESTGFAQAEGEEDTQQAACAETEATAENAAGSGDAIAATELQGAESQAGQSSLQAVTVHCNDDAKDYLVDNFGAIRSRLRSRADINEVAAANGVEFIFE